MDTARAIHRNSFIDGVRGLVTPSLVSKASTALGESEATIAKGLDAAISTIFGTLASKADDRGFMSRMFDMIKDPAAESNILGAFTGAGSGPLATSLSSRFLSTLFGERTESVAKAISRFAGVNPSTASSLLSLAGPLALGYLGKSVRSGGMNISSLSSMLLSQRSAIIRLGPASLTSVLGMDSQIADSTDSTVETAVSKTVPWQWLTPVLLILLGLWALVFLFGARNPAGLVSRSLPGGVQLKYARAGVEGHLLGFIEGEGLAAGTETWFDFDRLLFETNSAVLKPESQTQLSNVAAILVAYPNVKVKIGGYTDTSGDPAANLTLSKNRANTVMRELIRLGISPGRLSADGGQPPLTDNTTESGSAQNSSVAIRVIEK